MKKSLVDCLKSVEFTTKYMVKVDKNPVITSLAFDSRAVTQDALFFALPGIHVHGNNYIIGAIDKGAVAVIFEGDLDKAVVDYAQKKSCVLIQVDDARFSMAPISAAFYDNPSKKLAIIGVTATEGKSTTVFFAWQFLKLLGKKAGFISTVQYALNDTAIDNSEHQTTPEAPIVQKRLYEMQANNCEYAVIEASSHGLSKKTNRLGNVDFDAVAMLNVRHEHMEFHGNYDQYKSDKANLFRNLVEHAHVKSIRAIERNIPAIGIVNVDDSASEFFIQCAKETFCCGFSDSFLQGQDKKINDVCQTETKKKICDRIYSIKNIISTEDGISFLFTDSDLLVKEVQLNLPGTFNAQNCLVAMLLVSHITQTSLEDIIPLAKKLIPVKGRMTKVNKGQNFTVLVDYAHTPSSFETIFPPLRQEANAEPNKKRRIISVFGSGGERDTEKRPLQGKIAAQYSDIVVLTDEDPRGEEPLSILTMIASGCKNLINDKTLFLIPDRKKAIEKAFELAQADDIVLLLGKSHENSIIYKNHVMDYDEINCAETILEKIINKQGFTQ